MKIKCWYILFLTVILCSCAGNGTKTPASGQSDKTKNGNSGTHISGPADTLVIDKVAAVFYSPDEAKIEQAKKDDPDAFFTAADDNMYYMDLARQYLGQKHMNILDVKGEKYIKFISQNKAFTIVGVDTLSELWGIYLFDPKGFPENIEVIEIDDEYKGYFGN